MSMPEGFRELARLSPFNALVGPASPPSTFSVDYGGSAKVGDWVESDLEIQRAGKRLALANCYLIADGERIVRASGIFARTGKEP